MRSVTKNWGNESVMIVRKNLKLDKVSSNIFAIYILERRKNFNVTLVGENSMTKVI